MKTILCKKNLLIVKSIESEYVEEAFLFLKKIPLSSEDETEITREANRIIISCMKKFPIIRNPMPPLFWISFGGCAFSLLFFLVYTLI